ncbi:hypothetical protein M9H77_25217 [Catharanthus roseus]|uniref:Uncharacterized protein n=1 Tax=Catharanthus roseus TaxID=4058 RepID=A0ACC0A6I2_CATRO|nr:hypothetical protein M9H77_25217 [Catharanthus roseus]
MRDLKKTTAALIPLLRRSSNQNDLVTITIYLPYYYKPLMNKKKKKKSGSYLLQQESSSFSFRSERLSEKLLESSLSLSAKARPFLSQPSLTHDVKEDNRHTLSVIESRMAKENTNRQSVRKKRERRQKVRERECGRQRQHQQRKRKLGQAGRKEQYIAKSPGSGRVEPGPPGIKDQLAHSTPMRPSPVIHHKDKRAEGIK